MALTLISTVICDDVLRSVGGWLTLYGLFREVYAAAFPTTLPRLHLVTTWLNERPQPHQVIQRAALLSPDGALVADQATALSVQPGAYHTQIVRFRDLAFAAPGSYRVQVQAGADLVADLPLFVMESSTEVTKEDKS